MISGAHLISTSGQKLKGRKYSVSLLLSKGLISFMISLKSLLFSRYLRFSSMFWYPPSYLVHLLYLLILA